LPQISAALQVEGLDAYGWSGGMASRGSPPGRGDRPAGAAHAPVTGECCQHRL